MPPLLHLQGEVGTGGRRVRPKRQRVTSQTHVIPIESTCCCESLFSGVVDDSVETDNGVESVPDDRGSKVQAGYPFILTRLVLFFLHHAPLSLRRLSPLVLFLRCWSTFPNILELRVSARAGYAGTKSFSALSSGLTD